MQIYKHNTPLISTRNNNLLHGQQISFFLEKEEVIFVTNGVPYGHLHTSFFGFLKLISMKMFHWKSFAIIN